MKCPSFERLIDYLDGLLAPPEAEPVTRHLSSGCTQCGADREWYLAIKATTASDDSSAPPAWILKRAFRIFEAKGTKPGLVERLGQLVASLVFDSLARPAMAGVRSTETTARQLLYRAADFSIDLQVVPSASSRLDLIGQVLREGEAAFESVGQLNLELVRAGAPVFSSCTNEMGEFTVCDIDSGVFDLRIKLPEGTITVPDLPITLP